MKDWMIETLADGTTRVVPPDSGRKTVTWVCGMVFLFSVCCLGLALFGSGGWRIGFTVAGIAGICVTVPILGSNLRWEWRVGPDLLEVRQRSFLTGSTVESYRAAFFEIQSLAVEQGHPTALLFLCPAQDGKDLTLLTSGRPTDIRDLAANLAELTGWPLQERTRD